jgi:hypothetical protein
MHEADEILRRRPGLGALVGEAAALRAGSAGSAGPAALGRPR